MERPLELGSSGQGGLEKEKARLVHEGELAETMGLQKAGPGVGRGEEVVGNGAVHFLMEAVEFGAAGQVQDDEPAAGLEGGGEVAESGGLVAKVRKGVEAEDAVELAGRHGFGADVEKEELDREAAATGLGKHAG